MVPSQPNPQTSHYLGDCWKAVSRTESSVESTPKLPPDLAALSPRPFCPEGRWSCSGRGCVFPRCRCTPLRTSLRNSCPRPKRNLSRAKARRVSRSLSGRKTQHISTFHCSMSRRKRIIAESLGTLFLESEPTATELSTAGNNEVDKRGYIFA